MSKKNEIAMRMAAALGSAGYGVDEISDRLGVRKDQVKLWMANWPKKARLQVEKARTTAEVQHKRAKQSKRPPRSAGEVSVRTLAKSANMSKTSLNDALKGRPERRLIDLVIREGEDAALTERLKFERRLIRGRRKR